MIDIHVVINGVHLPVKIEDNVEICIVEYARVLIDKEVEFDKKSDKEYIFRGDISYYFLFKDNKKQLDYLDKCYSMECVRDDKRTTKDK